MEDKRVAVVDDDPKIRTLIRRCLTPEGITVDEAADQAQLADLLARRAYDLITLDLNLPDADGFTIARRIRETSQTPIIMVTGKGDVIDKVVGLEIGADDYIEKPFHVRELLARVKAVLRRFDVATRLEAGGEEAWQAGPLQVFPLRRAVVGEDGLEIALTTAEYNVLLALVEAGGRALTRDSLIDAAHGRHVATFDRTVDNTIARMRKRLPQGIIKTVRSVGYQLGVPAVRRALEWPHRPASPHPIDDRQREAAPPSASSPQGRRVCDGDT
ncbi:MAG: response regulator transcription factor [Pseudomonadota bacterium]